MEVDMRPELDRLIYCFQFSICYLWVFLRTIINWNLVSKKLEYFSRYERSRGQPMVIEYSVWYTKFSYSPFSQSIYLKAILITGNLIGEQDNSAVTTAQPASNTITREIACSDSLVICWSRGWWTIKILCREWRWNIWGWYKQVLVMKQTMFGCTILIITFTQPPPHLSVCLFRLISTRRI